MKILKTEQVNHPITGDVLKVTVEGYPNTQPNFPVGTSEADIITALTTPGWGHPDCPYSWEQIMNGAHWEAPIVQTVADITSVENNVLRVQTSVMAQNFYTESKTVDPTKTYKSLFTIDKLSNKATHKNMVVVNSKQVLDLEARVRDLEGVILELLKK